MPPKARKVKEAAAAKIKKEAEDEVAPLTYNNVDAVGLRPWKTSSKLTTAGKLGKVEAQWNVPSKKFTQTIEVQHNEPFALTPFTITEGKLKGQRVLLLAPVQNNDYFPFLDLPPELRKMVYDFLLSGQSTIKITTHKPPNKPRRPVTVWFSDRHSRAHSKLKFDRVDGKWLGQKPSQLSILSVNKQLRQEVGSAIYGRMFSFFDLTDLQTWLDTIGSFRVYVKHISITSWCRLYQTKTPAIFKFLTEADAIRSITLAHTAMCSGNGPLAVSSTVAELIQAATSSLKRLHKARLLYKDAVQVQYLFQIEPQSDCYGCQRGQGCNGLNCRGFRGPGEAVIECKDKHGHEEDLKRKVRVAIATAVGIKDE